MIEMYVVNSTLMKAFPVAQNMCWIFILHSFWILQHISVCCMCVYLLCGRVKPVVNASCLMQVKCSFLTVRSSVPLMRTWTHSSSAGMRENRGCYSVRAELVSLCLVFVTCRICRFLLIKVLRWDPINASLLVAHMAVTAHIFHCVLRGIQEHGNERRGNSACKLVCVAGRRLKWCTHTSTHKRSPSAAKSSLNLIWASFSVGLYTLEDPGNAMAMRTYSP